MTYRDDGRGEGWVGDVYVHVSVTTLAPGQYSATARITKLLWMATDGRLTVNEDTGELEVRYPSNGIIEYWVRKDGRALDILQEHRLLQSSGTSGHGRHLTLLVRRVTGMEFIPYHWAIQVDTNPSSIFELNGAMAIYGPNGLVAANSALLAGPSKGTDSTQFHGRLSLQGFRTTKSDREIEQFSKHWVRKHPIYNPAGPNCQTYAEDLFVFLTGENLPFNKAGDLKRGPEFDERMVWMNRSKRP